MIFNSLEFAIFLPTVFLLYWFVLKNHLHWQNLFLVIVSYVFYGWWDWRFLSLIAISTIADYLLALGIHQSEGVRQRKVFLWMSLVVNLGILGYFKYYNFFIENVSLLLNDLGFEPHLSTLQLILPVGISFYTFQTLSYTIDVYYKKIQPTTNFVSFAAFVSFFPQLVAGPIERAKHLLPQFHIPRTFSRSQARIGLEQILWGLFKKMVIADNCAKYATVIFDDPASFGASTLATGALFFTFQIYGDFSGYSDIAIGTARLFGFQLLPNFRYPYFSRNIGEFWRRWHISLSTWFRDYLYIPLGGSRGTKLNQVRNVFVIFLVSGFWHGANWTFIFWGLLNAFYFIPLLLGKRNRTFMDTVAENRFLPTLREFIQVGITFWLTVIGWIFFRSESLSQAWVYLKGLLSKSILEIPRYRPSDLILLIFFMVVIEWIGRRKEFPLLLLSHQSIWVRWTIYYLMIILIFLFSGQQQEFIYFQF